MKRIRLVLTIAAAVVAMVLCFAVPAMAYGPGGLIGEGNTDIKEGNHFVAEGQALIALGRKHGTQVVQRGEQAIREGNSDVRKGQRGGFGY